MNYDEIIKFASAAKSGAVVLKRKKNLKNEKSWKEMESGEDFNFEKYDYKVGAVRWRQKHGMHYFSITDGFTVTKHVEEDKVEDRIRWKAKNYFKTAQAAYKVIDAINAAFGECEAKPEKKERKKMGLAEYKARYPKVFEAIEAGCTNQRKLVRMTGVSHCTMSKIAKISPAFRK